MKIQYHIDELFKGKASSGLEHLLSHLLTEQTSLEPVQ
jgi:hypothetical protein